MSFDELLTGLDGARTAYDDATARLSDTIKQAQELRNELLRARDREAGWAATDVVDRLTTVRYHAMGIAQEIKACARAADWNLSATEPAEPEPAPVETVSSANVFARMAVGFGMAALAIVSVVFELLDKAWINDRTWGMVVAAVTIFYAVSYALGTSRERQAALRGMAVGGALFASVGLTHQVTGWPYDNWRTGAVGTAVLLATGALAYALRRRTATR